MYSYVFAALAGMLLVGCGGPKQAEQVPPPAVQVVVLSQKEVTIEKDFVGQVYGYRDIPVRARVEGFLESIAFEEGGMVRKGDLLYEVDPEPLLEAVAAAKSELARSEVNQERANSDYNRIAPLAAINAVSQRDLDAAVAEKKGSQSMSEAARANLRIAEIRLGYASVYAPIDGVIGKSMAQVGEFVGRSPNPVILNTISTIDSVRVEFFITESDYLTLARRLIKDPDDNNKMPLRLILSDGSVFPETGRVKFINREVDAATGAILIQAVFPNPDRLIRPGQFARVRAGVKTIPDALLVPQRCVIEVQGNFSVMRVNSSGEVEQVMIQPGPMHKDYYIIHEGISAGDRVIFEGLQRAKKGMTVAATEIEFKSQYDGQ
ncbi:MAG: efflux RND transporter periplasmic adaptor subunit [Cryomorphaceae bacterium]|nr:MAG: efflux RND transporter periplasmic adaptor subunit [Cryomorphaceae bacterium]